MRMNVRGTFALVGEAALVVAVYAVYSVIRVIVRGTDVEAFQNGAGIVDIERRLGIFIEPQVQALVTSLPAGDELVRQVYLWGYLPFIIGAAVLLYARNRVLYLRYRNAFFVAMAMGLVLFALLPTAPPRMFPELGFADLVNGMPQERAWKNEYAAVPSFHCGFTLLAAVALAHLYGFKPWPSLAVAVVPALMVLATVATANHWLLDAFAGWGVVLTAWWIAVGRPAAAAALSPRPLPLSG